MKINDNNLPVDRLGEKYQVVILTGPNNERPINEKEKSKLEKLTRSEFKLKKVPKINLQCVAIGRGATGAGQGFDLTEIFRFLGYTADLLTIIIYSHSFVNKLKTKFGKKRNVIYSINWLENYCYAEILAKTDEKKLQVDLKLDLTGSQSEYYGYVDHYLFLFYGEYASYVCIVNSSANIKTLEKITLYEGVEHL